MKKIIRWFAENHVASTLLMLTIIVGGLANMPSISRIIFPNVVIGWLEVSVPYRGAGPREIEERILIRIEEALSDVNGIKRVISRAREGIGTVSIETEIGADVQEVLNDVKTRIDSIVTFPRETETPQVQRIQFKDRVLSIAVSGQTDERTLRELGLQMRDELAALPNLSMVELDGIRNVEVSIEVSEHNLRKFGLSFDDVVAAVRGSSINLPAGSLRAAGGDIELKTRGQAYTGKDFEDIVVSRRDDGTIVSVRDVAVVNDGFEETPAASRLNGVPAVFLQAMSDNTADVVDMSRSVKAYVEDAQARMPEGIELTMWRDDSVAFEQRIDLLVGNALGGLILVFILLFLFLRPLIAFWVTIGIGISFLGPFLILPYTFVTINIISTFAFLLVLGIVVDDAIIVGESIHLAQEEGKRGREASILGAQRVSKPIIFAALTTMIAFVPNFFLPGETAQITSAIPVVVILTLMFSLMECLFILPHHLSGMKPQREPRNQVSKTVRQVQTVFSQGLINFSKTVYRPMVEFCISWRYATLASFIIALFLTFALMSAGWVRSNFSPSFTEDNIVAEITLPEGIAFEQTMAALGQIERSALKLKRELADMAPNVEGGFVQNVKGTADNNVVRVTIDLHNFDDMPITVPEIADRWRDLTGAIPDVLEFSFDYTANDQGFDIAILLTSDNPESLDKGTLAMREQLATYDGVYGIFDLKRGGQPEVALTMKPRAESLSLTLADVGRQVRQAFYGEEVERIPRGRDEVRVMVRYPLEERRSIENLTEMRIRTPNGEQIPFDVVADVDFQTGYAYIRREDGVRTNYVLANLKKDGATSQEIMEDLRENYYQKWEDDYPGLDFGVRGVQEEQEDFMRAFRMLLFFALVAIYVLIAIAFRSYSQPIIILTAVPFGFMGAIIGHLIFGLDISIMSYLGIAAAAGVVINDNLVLVDFINRLRNEGMDVWHALVDGAQSRFRPIVLTSATTFVGLFPIMMVQGVQAAFLTQMVVSLAFGVLIATSVTLLLVPALIGIGEDIVVQRRRLMEWLKRLFNAAAGRVFASS